MNVKLPPELEQFVERLVREGRYGSTDEIICQGMILLQEQEESLSLQIEDLRLEAQAGLDQANRGELIDDEEVFNSMRSLS
jgi:antitoxin ParD1/3/4